MAAQPQREVTKSDVPPPADTEFLDRITSKSLLQTLMAVRKGDFSVRMPVDYAGIDGKIADAINEIIDLNEGVSLELERLQKEVGQEGKTSKRATLLRGSGGWYTYISSVNRLVDDLVRPTNEMVRVIGSVAKGDLTQSMTTEVEGVALQGDFQKAVRVVNEMVEQLGVFSSEVTRVAREVGTEGKLGGQAVVKGASGAWQALTDSVNAMASNLTAQVRNISEVTVAIASGDLSKKITVDVRGELLLLKEAINTMVEQLRVFGSEVTRVAREVGTEGKLGGQALVLGVAGTWKDLTDSVNSMASNLTGQVRNISEVAKAIAGGDLTKKITVDVSGEILELKNTMNTMVDQLRSFSSEVTRVAREVGTEGKLGGQAAVPDVAGTWKDLTENVNFMASNLTAQVRNIAEVTTAVANGDLKKKITADVKGEVLELKNTINIMVDQLNAFSSEVTRVAREVGTEGLLGGQAQVSGVSGTWKDLTDSVNQMAANLTGQVRNIAEVTAAVAAGDLTKKITVDVKGEILQFKNTFNTMVDQLNAFSSEVSRVAREVGTEGKLGGQATVRGVGGTWKELTDNVNQMAENLTSQVRNIAEVTTAVANGNLTKKITVDVKGEIQELKNTINTMVDQLSAFSSEVTRVAREVGTEGQLGGQAQVSGVAGTWKDLTDSVNQMAANLTGQVRDIAEVTTAVASGVLSRKITVNVKGEILQLKNTINTMVDQLNGFASEVSRVAREVGTEGQLGGQALVEDVAGVWKELTDNVNQMALNLTSQVRNIAEVTTAVASGDLTRKITVDVQGEVLELKNTINSMVDQLGSFASEVTRVAREVGTEGKLGGQAAVKGVAGTWKDLTDSVNQMAANLTTQVRGIAEVTTAVANGDLTKKITVDVRGEILELKNTMNTMVDQLNSFSVEVTRVAREVGTEGKLGGQATVRGAAGVWEDLTDGVNQMASNLTAQVRNIADVTTAVAKGDLSKKVTVDVKGEILQLKDTINTMVDQLGSFASEVTRVAREVGTEGKLGGQANVRGVAGTWKELTDNVNLMAMNLTAQVRNIAEVTTAVAGGDLTKQITVEVKGEILQLKNTINIMVEQLNGFAFEVTRVAREVGTEGKLGGQAEVRGVAGTWKELTDNVNQMASNLTSQVRSIAQVVTGVAKGDLKRKLFLEAKGEIGQLAETINGMIDTLAIFGDQVTNVAREVGIDGKLGGQASVPGASGLWKDLTENVNQLAANLTIQVRAIAEVSTAVAKGDLSRTVTVEAAGELTELKSNINQMISNLRDTTSKTQDQDWLKSNLAKFVRLMQGQKDLATVAKLILSELSPLVDAQHGVFYIADGADENLVFRLLGSFAYTERKSVANSFKLGQGLIGQCALERQRFVVTQVPEDYVRISSGLGEGTPGNIVVIPILFEDKVRAILELASFTRFSEIHLAFLDQLTESIGVMINTIGATTQTEQLLKQSQSLAEELQSQQEELTESNKRLENQAKNLQQSEDLLKKQQGELQGANEELEERAKLLGEQKSVVENKNREVEQGRRLLEEKAEQLALTSKYKSEFLANMSHELRTPLNSLLILAKTLSDNRDGNMTPKQLEFAQTIHASGTDLLELIQDILDLSKIEAGMMTVDVTDFLFLDMSEFIERTFRQTAEARKLSFNIELHQKLPKSVRTDDKRLQQILKNLLSNAFKFTEKGSVSLKVAPAKTGWSKDHAILSRAHQVIGFSVVDTGIGIPKDKQRIIFEAFQQAEGSTTRKYGGTGLGLSISRELASLLGGEICLESEPGKGSSFTLYLSQEYQVSPKGRPSGSYGDDGNGSEPRLRIVEPQSSESGAVSEAIMKSKSQVPDDRESVRPGDHSLLIVEDDIEFARILLDMARERGFKGIVATHAEQALACVYKYMPSAITLDLQLPDGSGWTVLDTLKHDARTRHIPVQVISVEEERKRTLQLGALAYLQKPASKESLEKAFSTIAGYIERRAKNLLVVEDNEAQRKSIVALICEGDVETTAVGTGAEALELLRNRQFDCLVLDLTLPDMTGFEFITKIQKDQRLRDLPIIIHSGKDLTSKEEADLRRVSDAVIIKGVGSPERLLDETALFLHRVEAELPETKRQMLQEYRRKDLVLVGKKVLIVDDDMRNIFALTNLLEHQEMKVMYKENGLSTIELLKNDQDFDIILMDIMMPEMDGYETIRRIRKMGRYKKLPIIALTAKAMVGDREKCIEAGSTDYLSKPVDVDQLLSLLRVWLYR